MGPQHIAAENTSICSPKQPSFYFAASMGPQHIAAENTSTPIVSIGQRKLQWGRSTSLRKTFPCAARHKRNDCCFNGAAAHRCGKPVGPVGPFNLEDFASMGPQHIAAENLARASAWA